MTWRWKNIHFEAGDPPAGQDLSSLSALLEAMAERKKIGEDLLANARATLDAANQEKATIKEIAELHAKFAAAKFTSQKDTLTANRKSQKQLGIWNEQSEIAYRRDLRRLEVAEEQFRVMTDLGGAVSGFASSWGIVDDYSDSFGQKLAMAVGDTEQLNYAMFQTAANVLTLASPMNVFQTFAAEAAEAVGFIVAELESALPALNKATGAAGKLNAEIVTATVEVRQYGVGMEEAAGAMQSLVGTVGNFNRLGATTRSQLVALAAGMEQVGVSSDTTANLVNSMTRSLSMSTDAAQASIKSVAATARALEMPVSEMVNALDQAMPRLAQFGKDAPEVLKKVAAAAKATGISLDGLLGIVGQYDTWEGAAEAAGRLNAMMGGPLLNSIDLLNASDEERIRMLIGSMEASGKNWEAMSRFERQAFASAAGISDLNEAGKLFSTTLSEYDWQQTEAKQAEENAEAYNEMIQSAVPIMEKWKQVYMKAWGALSPIIVPVLGLLRDFADFLLGWDPWPLLIGGMSLWIGTIALAVHMSKRLIANLAATTITIGNKTMAFGQLITVQNTHTGANWAATFAQRAYNLALKAAPYMLAATFIFAMYKWLGPLGAAIAVLTIATILWNRVIMTNNRVQQFGLLITMKSIATEKLRQMALKLGIAGDVLSAQVRQLNVVGMLRLIAARLWETKAQIWQNAVTKVSNTVSSIHTGITWALAAAKTALAAATMANVIQWILLAAAIGLVAYALLASVHSPPLYLAIPLVALGLYFMAGALSAVSGPAYAAAGPLIVVGAAVALMGLGLMLAGLGAMFLAKAFVLVFTTLVGAVPLLPAMAIGLWMVVPPMALLAYTLGIFAAALWVSMVPLVLFTVSMLVLSLLALPISLLAMGLTVMSQALLVMAPIFAQWPSVLAFAGAVAAVAVSFAALAVSFLMIASVAPLLPLMVSVFTALAVVFALISFSIAVVATQMSNLMESMSELAGTGAVVTIGTSIREVAEAINDTSFLKTVALTGFMGATALAGGGGGGNQELSAAISELRAEVAQTNAIYRELTKQPIIIKVGDKTIKKHVNQELGTKVTRLVAANAAAQKS
jgi:hypothetical protein